MEQFVETIQYLLNISEKSCEEFYKMCSKPLRKIKSRNFLLAAMVRLCGNETEFGKLASKYTSLSYIPPEMYQ